MHISPFKGYIYDSTKVVFDQNFHEAVREDFNSIFDKGFFRPASNAPSYFVIEIKKGNSYYTGIVTLTSIQDYIAGKIKAHEQTMIKKQIVHEKLLAMRKAMIKPAAVVINENPGLNTTLTQIKKNAKPVLSIYFPDDTTRQSLWVVSDDSTMDIINRHFKKGIKAIIADGHHRFATIAAIKNKVSTNTILTAYFTVDQMKVFSFYRILTPLKHQSSLSIIKAIQKKVINWKLITSIPADPGDCFFLIHQQNTYAFNLKKNKSELWANVFHDLITNGIFKIKNESNSKRIYFEEATISETGFIQMKNDQANDFIFKLPSLNTDEVLHNKKLLPPKSTFFMPRIINGLVVHLM